jgi:hypothetical protein
MIRALLIDLRDYAVLVLMFDNAWRPCGDGVKEEAQLWLVAIVRWKRSCSHHIILSINPASLEASYGVE